MDAGQFKKVMEKHYDDAVNVVTERFSPPRGDRSPEAQAARERARSIAEEAVQNAAVYLLENLERFDRLTKSYFIQLAVSRAKNEKRGGSRREQRLMSAGLTPELAVIEEETFEKEAGRKPALPRAE